MVRSFEVVFWCVGLCAGGLVLVGAPLVATHWVHARTLKPEAITASVRLIGLVICLQWPSGMYGGGLLGLQRQVSANAIQVSATVLRLGGGALILWKISPTVQAFFLWQAFIAGAQTLVTAVVLTRTLPATPERGIFRKAVLLANWRYSMGSSLTTILAIVLTQADKVIVSKLLPLADFGYYTLAWTIGNALGLLVSPVFVAVFPRLTQLAGRQDTVGLARLYHSSSQLVSVALIPAAAVLSLFAREVVWAWTGDLATVAAIRPVLVAVTIGTALNGLMTIPYGLQLAHGWTRLGAWANAASVVVIVPLTVVLTKAFGTVGAASGWAVLNAAYVVFVVHAMHQRLLTSEQRAWYAVDIGGPLAGTLLALVPIRILTSPPSGRSASLLLVTAAAVVALAGAALASPIVRRAGLERLTPLVERRRGP